MLQYYLRVRGWARNRAFADTEYNVSDAPILPWHSDLAIIAGLCDLMKVCCCFNQQYTGAHCFPCYYVNAVDALILCNHVFLAHVSHAYSGTTIRVIAWLTKVFSWTVCFENHVLIISFSYTWKRRLFGVRQALLTISPLPSCLMQ